MKWELNFGEILDSVETISSIKEQVEIISTELTTLKNSVDISGEGLAHDQIIAQLDDQIINIDGLINTQEEFITQTNKYITDVSAINKAISEANLYFFDEDQTKSATNNYNEVRKEIKKESGKVSVDDFKSTLCYENSEAYKTYSTNVNYTVNYPGDDPNSVQVREECTSLKAQFDASRANFEKAFVIYSDALIDNTTYATKFDATKDELKAIKNRVQGMTDLEHHLDITDFFSGVGHGSWKLVKSSVEGVVYAVQPWHWDNIISGAFDLGSLLIKIKIYSMLHPVKAQEIKSVIIEKGWDQIQYNGFSYTVGTVAPSVALMFTGFGEASVGSKIGTSTANTASKTVVAVEGLEDVASASNKINNVSKYGNKLSSYLNGLTFNDLLSGSQHLTALGEFDEYHNTAEGVNELRKLYQEGTMSTITSLVK